VTPSDIGWLVAAGAVWLVLLLAVRAEQAQAARQDQQQAGPKCPCGGCGRTPGQHNEPIFPTTPFVPRQRSRS
jgi:hypothetical protein